MIAVNEANGKNIRRDRSVEITSMVDRSSFSFFPSLLSAMLFLSSREVHRVEKLRSDPLSRIMRRINDIIERISFVCRFVSFFFFSYFFLLLFFEIWLKSSVFIYGERG